MKPNVTIKDVARELDLHHVTVSRALRDSGSVSKTTKNRIKEKAEEMGYRPNLLAQRFRNKKSYTIAVLVPELQHHFFTKFITDFMDKAKTWGYSVVIFQSNDRLNNEQEIIKSLVDHQVDGVVASVSNETNDSSHFNILNDAGIPLVFFDRIPKDAMGPQVSIDNFQAAYDAVDLMAKSGRKRIAYLTTGSQIAVFQNRLKGYKQALKDNGLPIKEDLIVQGGFYIDDGINGAKLLMGLTDRPDAFLTVSDKVGIGAIKYLTRTNFKVPDDVCVIGFDNDPIGLASEPELSTVKQSISRMAGEVLGSLLNQIKDEGKPRFEKKLLKAEIVLRDSC